MGKVFKGNENKPNRKNVGVSDMKIKKKVPKIKGTDASVPVLAHATDPTEATAFNSTSNRNKKMYLDKENKKEKLPGFIFMCSSTTKLECYQYRVFGLPMGKLDVVEKMKPGTKLFLFDFESKILYGIYEATSAGQLNLEPAAFKGKFPAQVKFRIFKECLPLTESSLRHILKENYKGSKFNQELEGKHVSDLIAAFRPLSSQSACLDIPYVPLPLSNHHSVPENQFKCAAAFLAPENPHLVGLSCGLGLPPLQSYYVPSLPFSQHRDQRPSKFIDPVQHFSDHQGSSAASDYYVSNAQKPYSSNYLGYMVAQDPYSRAVQETAQHDQVSGIPFRQLPSQRGIPYQGSVPSTYISMVPPQQQQVGRPLSFQWNYSSSHPWGQLG